MTCDNPYTIQLRNGTFIMLPCSKCINCKTEKDGKRKQKNTQKSKKNQKTINPNNQN